MLSFRLTILARHWSEFLLWKSMPFKTFSLMHSQQTLKINILSYYEFFHITECSNCMSIELFISLQRFPTALPSSRLRDVCWRMFTECSHVSSQMGFVDLQRDHFSDLSFAHRHSMGGVRMTRKVSHGKNQWNQIKCAAPVGNSINCGKELFASFIHRRH